MNTRSTSGDRWGLEDRGASAWMMRLASNAKTLGKAWSGSPRPVQTVVWAVTWLVVGAITWLGNHFGLVPDVKQLGDFIRTFGGR
jgi:hypothetical protein